MLEKVIKGWAKVYEICDPVKAEAATILWALQIAMAENMERIEVEGNVKSCFEANKVLKQLKKAAPPLHGLSKL